MDTGDKMTLLFSIFCLGLVCYAIQIWGYLMDGVWDSFTINDSLKYLFNKSFSVDQYHRIFIIEKSLEFINNIFDSYNAGNVLIITSILATLIPDGK